MIRLFAQTASHCITSHSPLHIFLSQKHYPRVSFAYPDVGAEGYCYSRSEFRKVFIGTIALLPSHQVGNWSWFRVQLIGEHAEDFESQFCTALPHPHNQRHRGLQAWSFRHNGSSRFSARRFYRNEESKSLLLVAPQSTLGPDQGITSEQWNYAYFSLIW